MMPKTCDLLGNICTGLAQKYQTVYAWRAMRDSPQWIFVPQDASQPMFTVLMQDLIRTRCVNIETLLGFVHPYVFPVLPAAAPACRQCDAMGLEHFYTSKRDQTILCPACFAVREQRQVAKESVVPLREEEIALSSPPA